MAPTVTESETHGDGDAFATPWQGSATPRQRSLRYGSLESSVAIECATKKARNAGESSNALEGLPTKVLDRIHTNVNVNLACGDPRTVGETTIIPVGVVSDGFGLGMGTRPNANADSQAARGFSRSRS